jgi:YggT family protein
MGRGLKSARSGDFPAPARGPHDMNMLLSTLAEVINLFFQIYIFIVIARAIISWVNPDPYNPIVRFLYNATEPVLYRLRRLIPLQFGGFDFSPIVLLIGLSLLRRILLQLIYQLAFRF